MGESISMREIGQYWKHVASEAGLGEAKFWWKAGGSTVISAFVTFVSARALNAQVGTPKPIQDDVRSLLVSAIVGLVVGLLFLLWAAITTPARVYLIQKAKLDGWDQKHSTRLATLIDYRSEGEKLYGYARSHEFFDAFLTWRRLGIQHMETWSGKLHALRWGRILAEAVTPANGDLNDPGSASRGLPFLLQGLDSMIDEVRSTEPPRPSTRNR